MCIRDSLRAPGGPIIGGDGLAVAGRLAEAQVPGDHSGIDLAGEDVYKRQGPGSSSIKPDSVRGVILAIVKTPFSWDAGRCPGCTAGAK